jgi:Fe-S cluster biogenesis protein NfuA
VVALDGGDVVFAKYENNILSLQMKGACAGCPSSSATLKEGIEVRMRELFPEIKEVVSI